MPRTIRLALLLGALCAISIPAFAQRAPTPCRPAPPEDSGEYADPISTPSRWIFDDNKFCPSGPGIGCARFEPTGIIIDPYPGSSFVDSAGLVFEMYVVADCGTEMHIPLFDVESGCVSVFDENRIPIPIRVRNGAGFDRTGGEVCWNAVDCTGGFGNNPGGPGNERVMDVTFQGTPTLCGIYVVQFRSWGGCIWDLFANCDGTQTEQFTIYDDICEARAARSPLPEIVLANLTTRDAGGCTVAYCVEARNIGCIPASDVEVLVENRSDNQYHMIPALAPGATETLCGDLSVPITGHNLTTTVTAIADPSDHLLECTEAPDASSCSPASGANWLRVTQDVYCNRPPDCDSGGPYASECTGAMGGTLVPCTGLQSSDPDGDPLTYAWSTTCPGTFDDPTSATPVLIVPGVQCSTACRVGLFVTDDGGLMDACSASVTIEDTTPPAPWGCPQDAIAECDAVPGPAQPSSIDACDPAPATAFAETKVDGNCPGNYQLLRNWEFRDACGNSSGCDQSVTVHDSTPPTIQGTADDLYCLWPPNHKYVCLGADRFSPSIADNCSDPVTWQFTPCSSNQPDNAREEDPASPWNGDGNTWEDCILAPDLQGICARSERCGEGPDAQAGRRYGIAISARDACGNVSAPAVIGSIHVPHDQSPHERPCLKPEP